MKLNYVTVGTNDMEASKTFYDALSEVAGLQTVSPADRMTYWIEGDFAFVTALPSDVQSACNGNGTMIGFYVGSADEVERMHGLSPSPSAATARARRVSSVRRSRPTCGTSTATSCASPTGTRAARKVVGDNRFELLTSSM